MVVLYLSKWLFLLMCKNHNFIILIFKELLFFFFLKLINFKIDLNIIYQDLEIKY